MFGLVHNVKLGHAAGSNGPDPGVDDGFGGSYGFGYVATGGVGYGYQIVDVVIPGL
jgi:hypothetical protein